jgi:hypothetical protein
MKRLRIVLTAAIALVILSGCAVVPLGYHGGGGHGPRGHAPGPSFPHGYPRGPYGYR